MKASLARLVAVLQQLFCVRAESAAQQAGLIERQRQIYPQPFAAGLVFAWMQHPNASTEQLASFVTAAGSPISRSGLCQRFTKQASDFFLELLQAASGVALTASGDSVGLLNRFNGVYLLDATQFLLPACLADLWPSSGGDNGHAGIKCMALLELCCGVLKLELKPAKEGDNTFATAQQTLPAGALRLADLGFFDLDVLRGYQQSNVFYITRAQPHTTVVAGGQEQPLWQYLRSVSTTHVEEWVELGKDSCLKSRMAAWRCPQEVEARRRQKAYERARRHGRTVSAQVLLMCAWTVLFTNVPVEKLAAKEVWIAYRVRWQVELLFKRWKSLAQVGRSVGIKVHRVLSEVYAKLLGVVVRSWLLLLTAGGWPRRSGWKCFREVGSWARVLLLALGSQSELLRVLALLRAVLNKVGGVAGRKKKPATFQTLTQPQDNGPQTAQQHAFHPG
jgi:hypothetical protein